MNCFITFYLISFISLISFNFLYYILFNFFKKYNTKLNKIKEMAKRIYFSTQFYLNKESIKITWKLIGMIINRKKKSNIIIPKLLCNNRCYTDKRSICEQLNTYFRNVGPTLSAQLPIHRNSDPSKYIR